MSSAQTAQKASVDPKAFAKHLETLRGQWDIQRTSTFKGSDALAIVHGEKAEGSSASKAQALQLWLAGVELSDTVIVLTKQETTFFTSSKKAAVLQQLKEQVDSTVKMNVLKREKKAEEEDAFKDVIALIKKSYGGTKVAAVTSDPSSPFVSAWSSAVSAASLTVVDVDEGVSRILATKDDSEQKYVKTAASITVAVLKNFLIGKIESTIDEEKKVTHVDLTKETLALFAKPEKISAKLVPGVVEASYPPVIQSGSTFDLRPAKAASSTAALSFSTIVCSLGARYKHYSADVARTLFVDPAPSVQVDYEALLAAQTAAIEAIKPGATFAAVYKAAAAVLEKKKPSLKDNFLESVGFLTGLEYHDAEGEITEKSDRVIEKGMAFVVRVGLQKLRAKSEGNDEREYAILLADTILIGANGAAEVLTDKCTKKYSEVSYELGSAESAEEEAPKQRKSEKLDYGELTGFSLFKDEKLDAVEVGGRKLRNTVQRELLNTATSDDAKRESHQIELAEAMVKKALETLDKKDAEGEGEEKQVKRKDFTSYKNPADIPNDAQRDFIYVDNTRESILLPIYGNLVPFHINTVKSVTKSDEYLRIMFKTPAQVTPGETFKDPGATFIREVTFRITNQSRLNNSLRKIQELKKRITTRESESAAKASLKVQPDLILNKTGRNPKLAGLSVRPNFGGRKTTGTLETHTNGFRFSTLKNGNIDIIYDNIKYAFFQPAEKSLIVVVHFHLHSEIMVGKKKTQDVQFYLEVMEASLALGQAKSSRWGDAEEIEDEQRERELINKRNAEFQGFVKKAEEIANIEFDIPYHELGFNGVPNRNSVFLQPTVHCLINVIEFPFFVMPLEDIQIAYFERVSFGLRNFDLVFIFNDWSKKEVHVNSIPIESLEPIKDWLNESDIKYYQGNANINWRRLLDEQLRNPRLFWEEGGWAVLEEEESSEEEVKPAPKPKKSKKDNEDGFVVEEEEEEQAAAPAKTRGGGNAEEDDDDFEASAEYESSYDSGEEDSDSGSAFSEESGGGEEEEEEDDEAPDWDELEEDAVKSDSKQKLKRKERGDDYSSDEDERPKKKAKK